MKLKAGQKMPDFTYETPYETGCTLAAAARRVQGKTALVFLRYYGCTLCQYDILQYAKEYESIASAGGQLLVVLQSDPVKLAAQIEKGQLPFDIICDPRQELYRALEIAPAASKEEMIRRDEKTMAKFAALKESGLQHGEYEGEELQLPALFVVQPDLTVVHAQYMTSAADTPEPQELAALLR